MAASKTATLTLRIEPEIKQALQRAADLEHRSIANMVEVLSFGEYFSMAEEVLWPSGNDNRRTPWKDVVARAKSNPDWPWMPGSGGMDRTWATGGDHAARGSGCTSTGKPSCCLPRLPSTLWCTNLRTCMIPITRRSFGDGLSGPCQTLSVARLGWRHMVWRSRDFEALQGVVAFRRFPRQ